LPNQVFPKKTCAASKEEVTSGAMLMTVVLHGLKSSWGNCRLRYF
jgi:hypothetical protein